MTGRQSLRFRAGAHRGVRSAVDAGDEAQDARLDLGGALDGEGMARAREHLGLDAGEELPRPGNGALGVDG